MMERIYLTLIISWLPLFLAATTGVIPLCRVWIPQAFGILMEEVPKGVIHGGRNNHDPGILSIAEEDENVVSSTKMKMSKKEALLEFRCMVEDAILGGYILEKPKKGVLRRKDIHRDISIWGVPLLPSKCHPGTDTVLLKFLQTNDFQVLDAFEKLRKALKWRKEFKVDALLDEEFHLDLGKAMYINSQDKQGHPLFYESYEVFRDKELYKGVLGSKENREMFLRWRIQSFEEGIQKLSFKPGGADSLVHITDLKNSPGPEMKELHFMIKKAFELVQSHYPEIIHKHIVINVPFWYYTSHIITSKIMSATTKRKFVFARPSQVTTTLLKYISPENLPVKYGGLNMENDCDFSPDDDNITEVSIAANKTKRIKVPVSEVGVTIIWDYTVVGWQVGYQEEFIPDDEGSYNVLLRKGRQKRSADSFRNSFYINEPGKIVITIDNSTLKKKTMYYRYKVKPTMSKFINFKK